MFTGIISDIGTVLKVEQRGDLHARIGTAWDVAGIDIGASIACDGVCLTVVATGTGAERLVRRRHLGRDGRQAPRSAAISGPRARGSTSNGR